jgi:hypothetical protein
MPHLSVVSENITICYREILRLLESILFLGVMGANFGDALRCQKSALGMKNVQMRCALFARASRGQKSIAPLCRLNNYARLSKGVARATRTNGEKALILRAQSARKMSALNEKMHKWDAPLSNAECPKGCAVK